MAKKAEEYGSHDKTLEADRPGSIRVIDAEGTELLAHEFKPRSLANVPNQEGRHRRLDQLAVNRSRLSGRPVVLVDENRAHDANLIAYANSELPKLDAEGLDATVLLRPKQPGHLPTLQGRTRHHFGYRKRRIT